MSTSRLAFNPDTKYTKEELELFIKASGAGAEYDHEEKENKARYLEQSGFSRSQQDRYEKLKAMSSTSRSPQENDEYERLKASLSELTKPKTYVDMRMKQRHDFVSRLAQSGRLIEPDVTRDLSGKIIGGGDGKAISKRDIAAFLASVKGARDERDRIITWVKSKSPADFNVNALEELMKHFRIPISGSNKVAGSGDQKKEHMYDRIIGRNGHAGSQIKPAQEVMAILAQHGIRTYADLLSQTKDKLAQLSKQFNTPHTGSKLTIADKIAGYVGWDKLPSKMEVEGMLQRLRQQYPHPEERRRAILAETRLSPEALDLHLNASEVKALYDELNLSVAAKNKKDRITAITERESTISSARSNKVPVVFDFQTCNSMDVDSRNSMMKTLKHQIRNVSNQEKCHIISGHSELKSAEKILAFYNTQGESRKFDTLTRSIGSQARSEGELVRQLVEKLYVGKASVHLPDHVEDVRSFIMSGTLPQPHKLFRVAIVFADIAPNVLQMTTADQVGGALREARSRFIEPLLNQDVGAFQRNKHIYGFGVSNRDSIPSESRSTTNMRASNAFKSPTTPFVGASSQFNRSKYVKPSTSIRSYQPSHQFAATSNRKPGLF